MLLKTSFQYLHLPAFISLKRCFSSRGVRRYWSNPSFHLIRSKTSRSPPTSQSPLSKTICSHVTFVLMLKKWGCEAILCCYAWVLWKNLIHRDINYLQSETYCNIVLSFPFLEKWICFKKNWRHIYNTHKHTTDLINLFLFNTNTCTRWNMRWLDMILL